MNRRDALRCDKCRFRCNDIKDLAIHNAEHLTITVPFAHLCPFCDSEMENLKDLFLHVIQHLIEDQLEQARVIKWLSLQNYEPDSFICKSESDLKAHKDFQIILPQIEVHNKCLFCSKYLSPEPTKKVLHHFFTHLISSSQKILRAALWTEIFFKLEESRDIIKSYHEFKILDLNSILLAELNLFKNNKTSTCRYCQKKFSTASTLYSHYIEWHSERPSKNYNCIICNYKESEEAMFIQHIYKRHVGCVCGEKFPRFQKCLTHVKGCVKYYCPYCKNKFDSRGLVGHLTRGERVGSCPFCQENMKSDRLVIHLSNCPSRGVPCPTCRNYQFVKEGELENHLLFECKPWITNSNVVVPCLNGSRRTSQVQEKNNVVKFDDIQICLTDDVIEKIEDCFS